MEFKKCLFCSMIILWVLLMLQGCSRKKDLESPSPCRVVIYHIVNMHDHADFNYPLINEYKSSPSKWGSTESVIELFRPVHGEYRVIEFMAALFGNSQFDEKEKLFHEILILKVDSNNIIRDGLQYPLEMREPPLSSSICSLESKDVKLTRNLNLSDLQFRTFPGELESEVGYVDVKTGILDNVYDFKEQF